MLVFKVSKDDAKEQSPALDLPWVIENIEAVFDDALTLLTDGCIIYGGALRDSIAWLELTGDLDIAVPSNEYRKVLSNFNNSPRWIDSKFPKKKGNYERPSEQVIRNVTVYKDLHGKEVQLIQAHSSTKLTSFPCDTGVVNLVRRVDMRCSGIMMNNMGKVFEVIEGALEDCKNRRLIFNEGLDKNEVFKKTIEKRVKKLTARGWNNLVDLTKFKK